MVQLFRVSFFFMVLFTNNLFAAIFYVKTNGNDRATGLTYASAFKTVQRALDVANAGDDIYVDKGNYFEKLIVKNSGRLGTPIRILNYSGGIVNIDGSRENLKSQLVLIDSKNFIKFDGINFQNYYGYNIQGLKITGNSKNIVFNNCEFRNIGWNNNATLVPTNRGLNNANAILVEGTQVDSIQNINFTNCRIHDCVTGFSEGVTFVGNVSYFLFESNYVYNITNIGVDCAGHSTWDDLKNVPAALNQSRYGTIRKNFVFDCVSPIPNDLSAGIYADGAKEIVIEKNYVFRNLAGVSVGCEIPNFTATSITVRDNFIHNNQKTGLVFGSGTMSSLVTNSTVSNNSFYRNNSLDSQTDGAEIAIQNSDNNNFFQNIIVPKDSHFQAIGLWGYTTKRLTLNYNLFWRPKGDLNNLFTDNIRTFNYNAVYGDPKFKNSTPGSIDLHLNAGSKAINAGNPNFKAAYGETDIDSDVRVQNNRVDIGADETALSSFTDGNLIESIKHFSVENQQNSGWLEILPLFNDAIEKITISDMGGRIVYNAAFSENRDILKVDIKSFQSGAYVVSIDHAGSQPEIHKFVIAR